MTFKKYALLAGALIAYPAAAQDHSGHSGHQPETPPATTEPVQPAPTPTPPAPDHSAMDHAAMDHSAMDHGTMDHSQMDHGATHGDTAAKDAGARKTASTGSGTARLPANEGMMHGLHLASGDWMVMAHGYAQANYTDHSGPRGDDKFYVTSMGMITAETAPDWGRVQLKSMFSLEPLMSRDGYPNLFATGETAYGVPLVDRQHPHDLFMELAGRVDVNIADDATVFLYGGPVGEPAIGPSAFMHRASAALNPEPPITHHWFDSTHITYGVVTAGYSSTLLQLEASAFRGAEPDEERWGIETPRLDSWSVRGSLMPTDALAIQASYAQIKEPEAVHPGEDEHRFTASANYTSYEGFSAMLAYSRKQRIGEDGHGEGDALPAWLAEASWDLTDSDTVFGRFENVVNDEFFGDHDHPLHDQRFRVSKFQLGYARSFDIGPTRLSLGASGALYAKPDALDPYYGKNPFGLTVFARVALGH